jgi:hypothetical protein
VAGTSSTNVLVSFSKNTTNVARICTLTFRAPSGSPLSQVNRAIQQKAATPNLVVNPDLVKIENLANGRVGTFYVSNSGPNVGSTVMAWSATVNTPNVTCPWITSISPSSGTATGNPDPTKVTPTKVTVYAAAPIDVTRRCKIVFTSSTPSTTNNYQERYIEQAGATTAYQSNLVVYPEQSTTYAGPGEGHTK